MIILPIKTRREILESRNKSIKTTHTNSLIIITSDFLGVKNTIPNNDFVRLLVVVSKKVDNRAVIRNKFKRQIREIFRNLDDSKLKRRFDYQIIAKRQILDKSFREIKGEIENNII
jgi:ribonuclease P protein component